MESKSSSYPSTIRQIEAKSQGFPGFPIFGTIFLKGSKIVSFFDLLPGNNIVVEKILP